MALVEPKIFEGGYRSHSVIVACVADEYHQLGARMVADLFELNGWRGYFLGASTPVQDLLSMIDEKKPDIVALSLSIYFNLHILMETLDRIKKEHPDLPILVGGQAFRWGGTSALAEYPTVIYIPSIEALESVMEQVP
ncbi:MAG: cobalamin B12-binding domain-containing protein [Methanocalculus sp. MSAO_Arc1]|nr:MAG: cobalamin B12-binding domain-containing protein [Methanocalculus sp. MSAO_Arc1]